MVCMLHLVCVRPQFDGEASGDTEEQKVHHPEPPFTQEDDKKLSGGLSCYYPGCGYNKGLCDIAMRLLHVDDIFDNHIRIQIINKYKHILATHH